MKPRLKKPGMIAWATRDTSLSEYVNIWDGDVPPVRERGVRWGRGRRGLFFDMNGDDPGAVPVRQFNRSYGFLPDPDEPVLVRIKLTKMRPPADLRQPKKRP
jgi:hypothetical protein